MPTTVGTRCVCISPLLRCVPRIIGVRGGNVISEYKLERDQEQQPPASHSIHPKEIHDEFEPSSQISMGKGNLVRENHRELGRG